jgi:hypothetical protein
VVQRLLQNDPDFRRKVKVEMQPDIEKAYSRISKDKTVLGLSPKNTAETIAHELGHATPKSRAGRAIRFLSGMSRKPGMAALPTLMALSGVANTSSDLNPVAKASPYVGGLMLASHLLEEGRANMRAEKLLRGAGWNRSLPTKLRMYLPTLTYLAKALPLIAIPMGINKGISSYNKSPAGLGRVIGGMDRNVVSEKELESKWLPETAENANG